METFMNAINSGITATSIWESIAPVGGLIVVVTLVALGVYVVNKNLRAVKSHKAGRA